MDVHVPSLSDDGPDNQLGANRFFELWVLACVTVGVTLLMSAFLIGRHLRRFLHHPAGERDPRRRHVIFILFLVPVFTSSAFATLFLPELGFYLDPIRLVYEAFVVQNFFELFIALMGGEEFALQRLARQTPQPIFATLPVFCLFKSCFPKTVMTRKSYQIMKQFVLQLVIVAPFNASLAVVAHLRQWNHVLFLAQGLNAISMAFALYALFVFYGVTYHILRSHRTTLKFVAIKLGVFFVIIQKFLLTVLVKSHAIRGRGKYSADQLSEAWQSFLVILEFFCINLLHSWAFPVDEFEEAPVLFSPFVSGSSSHPPNYGCDSHADSERAASPMHNYSSLASPPQSKPLAGAPDDIDNDRLVLADDDVVIRTTQ